MICHNDSSNLILSAIRPHEVNSKGLLQYIKLLIMASEIKEISKFSADATDMVYEKLPEEEKEHMKDNLRTMLGLSETKKQTTT